MPPNLVPYLLYEPEESGILWIKFNRPERMNALIGSSEENGTVAKVGEYMRAGDDDPNVRVMVLSPASAAVSAPAPTMRAGQLAGHYRRELRGHRGTIRGARCRAGALLPRLHQVAPGHLPGAQAHHRHDQRARPSGQAWIWPCTATSAWAARTRASSATSSWGRS